MENEKIICAADTLFGSGGKMAAAVFSGEETVWENERFSLLSENFTREAVNSAALSAVASENGTFRSVRGTSMLTASVMHREEEICIVGVSDTPIDTKNMPAVGIEANKVIYENELFLDSSLSDIKEGLINLAFRAAYSADGLSSGVFGGLLYRAYTAGKGDDSTALVLICSENIFAGLPREVKDKIIEITSGVRHESQNIDMCSDSIYDVGKVFPLPSLIVENLNGIDRSMLRIRSEFLILEELVNYGGERSLGKPVDLEKFARNYCEELLSVLPDDDETSESGKTGRKLSVNYSCEKGLTGFFRPETLNLLLSGMIQKYLEKNKSGCSRFNLRIYSSVSEESGEKMIYIDSIVSEYELYDDDDHVYGRIAYPANFAPIDLYDSLAAAFCREFGCSRYIMDFGDGKASDAKGIKGTILDMRGPSTLGIVMPICRNKRMTVSVNRERLESLSKDWKNSPSRVMLSGSIFRKKFK